MSELMNAQELSKLLNISRRTFARWEKEKIIPCYIKKSGNLRFYSKKQVKMSLINYYKNMGKVDGLDVIIRKKFSFIKS